MNLCSLSQFFYGFFQPNTSYRPAFVAAVNFVFSNEGGYHCNPNDFGGETHFGISAKVYVYEDVASLNQARAQFFYIIVMNWHAAYYFVYSSTKHSQIEES